MLGPQINEILVHIRLGLSISFDELIVGNDVIMELIDLVVMLSKEFEGPEACGLPLFGLGTKSVYPLVDIVLERLRGMLRVSMLPMLDKLEFDMMK